MKDKTTDLVKHAKKYHKKEYDALNNDAKSWLLDPKNIDLISKAIAVYIFRNGPIEDYHSEGTPIGQEEMKKLNIFMADRIAGLLTFIINGDWSRLVIILNWLKLWTTGWNLVEPTVRELNDIFLGIIDLSKSA